jgi:hypothetical protein
MARLAKQGPTETSANSGKTMSRLDKLTESFRGAVGADSALGKTLKFDLKGEGFIYIDGASVTNEDKPVDLTFILTIDDLKATSTNLKASPERTFHVRYRSLVRDPMATVRAIYQRLGLTLNR